MKYRILRTLVLLLAAGIASVPASAHVGKLRLRQVAGLSEMSGMAIPDGTCAAPAEPGSPVVEFPYGFPTAGRYRIFIQMKHSDIVETGVFDVEVQ